MGTLILPEQNKIASRKHWIAFTLKPQGEIIVDDGAKDAMLEKGSSLLPSGIMQVRGEFDAGEAVSCCDADGVDFARGLTSYGSAEIERIKGLQDRGDKAGARPLPGPEVINRDDLVVLREK